MTLLFAATGSHPVVSEDGEVTRIRALQALTIDDGRFADLAGAIAALIDPDRTRSLRALDDLAARRPTPSRVEPRLSAPTLTELLLDQIIDGLRDRLVAAAQAMVADVGAAAGNDASYYNGAAGIGFELLHHLDRPGVRDTVAALGPFAHAAALRTQLPPCLYLGTTGVQIFLRSLLDRGIQTPLLPAERLMPESWSPEDDDLLVGCAGLGLGHLMWPTCRGCWPHPAPSRGQPLVPDTKRRGRRPACRR
jgi:hypothetical protein